LRSGKITSITLSLAKTSIPAIGHVEMFPEPILRLAQKRCGDWNKEFCAPGNELQFQIAFFSLVHQDLPPGESDFVFLRVYHFWIHIHYNLS